MYNHHVATILIIETDKKLQGYLKDLLTKKGYEARTSGGGAGALSLIDKLQPDLLILDRKITDVRGESLCWEIKEEYPDLPTILLLEQFEVERVTKLYRAGADDFIAKPIKTNRLLSRIKIQLASRQTGKTEYQVDDLVLNLKTFQVKRRHTDLY